MKAEDQHKPTEIAVFGGGCFWCTEALFKSLKGVISAQPGYTGGNLTNPSYEKVSTGNTGHVECVKIIYNPEIISYEDLLTVFFYTHNPTVENREGADIGTQYQSSIFYTNELQRDTATRFVKELEEKHAYDRSITTKIKPLEQFFEAEDYHKDYYENHRDAPYCELVISPKLDKLQGRFNDLLKDASGR